MPAPVVLVTGMSRGIGRAIAEELQSRGAAVVGAARNVADVPATAGLLPVAADVTQETGRQALLAAALARHGLAVGRAKGRRPTPKGCSGVAPGILPQPPCHQGLTG
jgi:NAD(P)-dependent dehydrogenase (short-subunit alcohol dehydrogenase family)